MGLNLSLSEWATYRASEECSCGHKRGLICVQMGDDGQFLSKSLIPGWSWLRPRNFWGWMQLWVGIWVLVEG